MEGILNIQEIQKKLLEMAKVIHDILSKNDIPYMITYGTLLGAIRHKGFIPWDDDFDIYLFGDSYQKAIEILRKELPDDLFLEDAISEPLYFHAWPHVKDKNTYTKCDQFPQDNIYSHNGLSIDLYITYEMKDKEIDLFRLRENLKYQERKYRDKLLTTAEYENICNVLKVKIEEEILNPKVTSSKNAYGMLLSNRAMYPNEIFPLKKYKFEDTEFYGPNDYDTLLKRFYGDYMKLPKKENRKPHYSFVKKIE